MGDTTAPSTPTRDRSETPDTVLAKVAPDDGELNQDVGEPGLDGDLRDLVQRGLSGLDDIKLTRLGHYHAGGGDSGRCFAALVTGVHLGNMPDTVDVTVWPAGIHDTVTAAGGETGRPVSINVPVDDPSDSAEGTFHLSRECPWGR